MEQLGIGLFGVLAIWLSQDKRDSVRRWACWSGLAAQPFWFWTTAKHGQWIIMGLSFLYTWSWLKGVRTYWLPVWRPLWREFWYEEVFPTQYDPLGQRKPRLKVMDWVRR